MKKFWNKYRGVFFEGLIVGLLVMLWLTVLQQVSTRINNAGFYNNLLGIGFVLFYLAGKVRSW